MARKNGSSYLEHALKARREAGVGVLQQFAEIVRLRYSPSAIGFSEYYNYRLFDRGLSPDDRRQFAGYRRESAIDRLLNKDYWRAVANDKLVLYATLRGLGFPYPRVRAVCHAGGRRFADALTLGGADELHRYLANADYPLFLKPIHGSFGRGACSAAAYDVGSKTLLLGNGGHWPLAEAASACFAPGSAGYIVQDLVKPHESIREFCRATASSVRIVVLNRQKGPEIFRCAWKIPVGNNMSDNFMHGESGNLLACVDPESGRVKRVITGPGFALREVDDHPETGQPLREFGLPNWSETRALCLSAASCYPGLRLQNWDVAVGEAGPVILEVNVEGSMDLHQLAGARGILDQALLDAVAEAERSQGRSRT
jgi:hypothetical protein